jgi:predicted TIM-barrel fold metal-dependent hydrolase
MSRAVNDALAEKISEHPTRFGGFASLAVHNGDEAAKELERCVKTLGFKGVLFNGYSQVDGDDNLVYLDEDRCAPIWAARQDLDVPLYLHPRTSYEQLMYKGHRELICANWGYPCETGTHAVRILVGGVFDRFPNAKMILGHNGENIPFSAWRLQH